MVDSLLKRRFLFCGGKGGVGKTTIATTLALHAAESNRQTLLVSTDPAHSLGDLLEQELSTEPRLVRAGLMAMELDPDHAVDAYLTEVGQQLREYVKPALYNEVDRQLEEARQTPGASEAALLERITAIISSPPEGIDQIIFDTAPTGHTMRLMSLPETMAAWTEGLLNRRQESDQTSRAFRDLFTGQSQTSAEQRRARLAATLERRRRRFRDARTMMADPDYTGFVMVLVPERLPIEETRRAVKMLDKHPNSRTDSQPGVACIGRL